MSLFLHRRFYFLLFLLFLWLWSTDQNINTDASPLRNKQRQAVHKRPCTVYWGRSPDMQFNKAHYYFTLSKVCVLWVIQDRESSVDDDARVGKWQIEETCGEVYDSGPRLLFQLCWLCWLWNCEESFGEVRWCSSHSVIPSYPPILTPADAPDSLDLQAHVHRWPAGSQHPGALKLGNLLCLYSDSHGCSSWMSSSSSNYNNLVSSLWIGIASYKVEDFFFFSSHFAHQS